MGNYKAQAKKIVQNNIYMAIATASKEGKPWISPVFYAFDKNYNLFWVSNKNSLHSILLRKNPQAAIVIFDSSVEEGDGQGVYFEVDVEELSDEKELNHAMEILGKRVTKDEFRVKKINDVTEDAIWRIYKASPTKTSVLTEGEYINGQYADKRVDVDLV